MKAPAAPASLLSRRSRRVRQNEGQRIRSRINERAFARLSLIIQRARTRAGIQLQHAQAAWMLLVALRVPVEHWVALLAPTQGQLPANDAQCLAFQQYIKRFGHLAEGGAYALPRGATQGRSTFPTFPGQEGGDGYFFGNPAMGSDQYYPGNASG